MTVYDPDALCESQYPDYPGTPIPITVDTITAACPEAIPRNIMLSALSEHQQDLRVGGGSVGVVSEFMSRSEAKIQLVTDSAVLLAVESSVWSREVDWLGFGSLIVSGIVDLHTTELHTAVEDVDGSLNGYCISVPIPLASLNNLGVSDVFTVGERAELLYSGVGFSLPESVLYAISTWYDDSMVVEIGDSLFGLSESQSWSVVNGVRLTRDELARELGCDSTPDGWMVFREAASQGGVPRILER